VYCQHRVGEDQRWDSQPSKMGGLDFDSVGYGPVRLAWGYNRVADYLLFTEKLREKLPPETQVFGTQERCDDTDECYTYQMVLWPPPQQDEESPTLMEWKSSLQEAVAELDTLDTLNLGSESGHPQPVWDVKSCVEEGEDPTLFVMTFVYHVEWKETMSKEKRTVFFGEVAFEYDADGWIWYEEHFRTADGGYDKIVTSEGCLNKKA